MKKYFISFLLLLIAPSICLGASARYTRLVREKQRKIEELEKCMGTNKGLQIAGISTLGLTAVGVAGNIAEAKIIKDNTKTIEKQEKTIQEKEESYKEKKKSHEEAVAAEKARIEEYNRTHTLAIIATEDIAKINGLAGNPGDSVITRGYVPEELPASLRSQFADAVIKFITNCKGHDDNKKSDNIKTTKFGGGWTQTDWNAYKQIVSVSEEEATKKVIPEDYTENTILQCLVNECNDGFYTPDNEQCIKNQSDEKETEETTAGESNKNKKVVSTDPGTKKGKNEHSVIGDEQKNKFKAACESPESGGKWRNTVCDCGKDKVENFHTHKCEDPDDDGAASPKKCNADTLNKLKATDGIVEGNKCKVTECKGNLVKNETNTICECPSDKPKYDAATFTCSAKTTTGGDQTQWTAEKIQNNLEGFCTHAMFSAKPNTYSKDLMACCDQIYNYGNATSWNGKECICKDDMKWEGNKCVPDVNTTETGPKDYEGKVIYYSRVSDSSGFKSDRYAKAVVDGKVYEYRKSGVGGGPSVNRTASLNGLKEKLNVDYKNYNLVESE